MKKSVHILFTCFVLLSVRSAWARGLQCPSVQAQSDLPSAACPLDVPSTSIVYINGINTSPEDAVGDACKLKEEFLAFISVTNFTLPELEPGCLRFELAYNTSEDIVSDLFESAHLLSGQEPLTFWSTVWRSLERGILTPDPFSQILGQQILGIDPASYVNKNDLAEHVQEYREDLFIEHRQVVTVAHSEGNLYANLAYKALYHPEDGQEPLLKLSFGIVAVATPANFVAGYAPGHEPYTTNIHDVILQAPGGPLQGNVPDGCGDDPNYCHSFIGTYLKGSLARPRIFGDIVGVIVGLESPPLVFTTGTPRGWLGSAVVGDAIYLIGGGTCEGCISSSGSFGQSEVANVETYDPVANTSEIKAPLQIARWSLTIAEVNGRIYALGGTNGSSSQPVSTVEEYNLLADTWAEKASMPTPRWKLTSAVVNGRIYAIGGGATGNQCIPSGAVEEYNPQSNTWALKNSMPTPRWGAASVAVNGQIYVIGGSRSCPQIIIDPVSTLEVYNPSTDSWASKAPMITARWDLAAAAVSGKIYAIGGWDPQNGRVLQTVEEYNPASNTWVTKSSMPTARTGLIAAVINGQIYTFGGFDGSQVTNVIEVYDPVANTWSSPP